MRRFAALRLAAGLGGLATLALLFPRCLASARAVVAATAAVGVSYGLAFGASYALVARFPDANSVALTTGETEFTRCTWFGINYILIHACPAQQVRVLNVQHTPPLLHCTLNAFLFLIDIAGFVSSGPLVLVLDLSLKDGPYYDASGLHRLFNAVAFQAAVAAAAAVFLLHRAAPLLARADALQRSGSGGSGGTGAGKPWSLSDLLGRSQLNFASGRRDGSLLAAAGVAGGYSPRFPATAAANALHGKPPLSQLYGSSGAAGVANSSSGSLEAGSFAVKGGALGRLRQRGDAPGSYSGSHRSGSPDCASEDGFAGLKDIEAYGSPSASLGRSGSHDPQSKGAHSLPLVAVFWRVSPAAAAIFISVGSSMVAFPFFTYVHSAGRLGPRLPQVRPWPGNAVLCAYCRQVCGLI